jgi:hypothetical protein
VCERERVESGMGSGGCEQGRNAGGERSSEKITGRLPWTIQPSTCNDNRKYMHALV